MSKENNLKDYLTDLYQGIVSKKPGASRNPQNFRSEIEQIETKSPEWDGGYETSPDTEIVGGECPAPNIVDISNEPIINNGTYEASELVSGADGIGKFTVAVPAPEVEEPKLIPKTVTENGTYLASGDGADGYSEFTVDVPTGGGSSEMLKGLIEGTLTEISDDSVTYIGENAFCYRDLKGYSFPNAKYIGYNAFVDCWDFETLDFPSVERVWEEAFHMCQPAVRELTLPSVKKIGGYAFCDFSSLKRLVLPCVEELGNSAFQWCQGLESVVIATPSVCKFGMDVFGNFDDWGVEDFTETSLRIYVTANLVDAYKSATNSAEYADIILPKEE